MPSWLMHEKKVTYGRSCLRIRSTNPLQRQFDEKNGVNFRELTLILTNYCKNYDYEYFKNQCHILA